MDNSKVLIVGGAGFVGSNLSHYLLENYNITKLYIIDNLISADISNVPIQDNVEFIFGSITSDRILNQIPEDLDYVFHLSCYHGNQSSIADPLSDHENNTLTTLKLFEKIKSIKSLSKVVYAAAGCAVAVKTYDEPEATLEDAPVSLFHDSPYSISKLIGEMYGNYYFKRYGMPFCKARFQNVYGPREILGAGSWRGTVHTVWRNVTPTFIWKSLHGEALPLDNGGNASRDFIFVKDLVRGLIAIAEKGEAGEAYNLASGIETSILDLANTINAITENKTPIDLKPAREWDTSGKRYGSTIKSKEKLGFEAKTTIEEGLRETISWTRKHNDFIALTMKRYAIYVPDVAKY
jgi:UDP-glucose 4-epimerase